MNDTIPRFNMLDKTGGSFEVAGLLSREFSLEPKASKYLLNFSFCISVKLVQIINSRFGFLLGFEILVID